MSGRKESTSDYVNVDESLDQDSLVTYVKADLSDEFKELGVSVETGDVLEEGIMSPDDISRNDDVKYGRSRSNISRQYETRPSTASTRPTRNGKADGNTKSITSRSHPRNPKQKTTLQSKSKTQSGSKSKKKSPRKSKVSNLNLEQVLSDDTWATTATMKSAFSTWTVGTGFITNVEYLDEDLDNLLYGNDAAYVQKRFGVATLIITLIQLFVLTMILAMCGFAAFFGNPGIGPYPDALSSAGATNAYLIEVEGQYWRFFTSPLIPAGIVHLLLNTVVQLEVGAYLERKWGIGRWLFIYFFSGFGSVTFSCLLDYSEINVAGTGALMGLIGAQFSDFLKVICFRTKAHQRYEDSYHQQILMILIILVLGLLSIIPYVSWAGHIGGFFAGFCGGMIVLSSNIKSDYDKNMYVGYGMILALLVVVFACSAIYEKNAPDYLADACQFYNDIHVENYDCMCGF